MTALDLKIIHLKNYTKLVSVFFILFYVASCAAPTRTITEQDLFNKAHDYRKDYVIELDNMFAKSYTRLTTEYLNELNGFKEQSYDILVLSGGGELGAFGAGFLDG